MPFSSGTPVMNYKSVFLNSFNNKIHLDFKYTDGSKQGPWKIQEKKNETRETHIHTEELLRVRIML
jgi:hypothetical protein